MDLRGGDGSPEWLVRKRVRRVRLHPPDLPERGDEQVAVEDRELFLPRRREVVREPPREVVVVHSAQGAQEVAYLPVDTRPPSPLRHLPPCPAPTPAPLPRPDSSPRPGSRATPETLDAPSHFHLLPPEHTSPGTIFHSQFRPDPRLNLRTCVPYLS